MENENLPATQLDPYTQPEAQPVDLKTKEKELTNEEYDVDDEGKFEQHAHKPTLPRTQSALAVHLTEDATGCKRELIERARTVEEQCTAIIGKTPWPFSICWLCGFPVGEQTNNGPTMLQSIASSMKINCLFVNPLSARWDKQTCEHVNPINIAGSAFLNKGPDGYKYKNALNIRMEYESAHDFCNILKNEGYLITLKDGKVTMSFKGLTVATWQINAWPNFLLNGSMNGPSLSSVICFSRKDKNDQIQKVFLKSPIHGYLFLKVLEKVNVNEWDGLFDKLQPTDELAYITIGASDMQLTPALEAQIDSKLLKTTAVYFKGYVTSRQPKRTKTNPNPGPGVSSIHTILSIALIHNVEFKNEVDRIVNTWKEAIKKAMIARTNIFVDYILRIDGLVGGLLWPLMKSSTQQTTALYNGKQLTYNDLDEILTEKLQTLKNNNIAVPVLTQEERRAILVKHRAEWGLPAPTKIVRPTQRDKLPQPVAGLPVSMSLSEYTNPPIFRFIELEKQKASEVQIAYGAVAASLYSDEFRLKLKKAVETGQLNDNKKFIIELKEVVETGQLQNIIDRGIISENDNTNPTVLADKLITTVEDTKCIKTGDKRKATSNKPNNDGNNGSAMPTTNNNPIGNNTRKKPRTKFIAARTLSTPPSPQQTTGSQGGTRKQRNHRKLRNYRNHRTHKQKKNKKTRKNKKLTKRF